MRYHNISTRMANRCWKGCEVTELLYIAGRDAKQQVWYSLNCVRPFATAWTVAHQAPLSMKLSRQEYWSGEPFLSSRDLPNPGIKPRSPALQVDALPSEAPGKPRVYTGWYIKLTVKCAVCEDALNRAGTTQSSHSLWLFIFSLSLFPFRCN